jgi:hypothetical protein
VATTVNFNGLTFSSDFSATYKLQNLDGWYSAPPVRPVLTERPNADGSFNTGKVYRSNRVITLTGWVVSASSTEAIATMWRGFTSTMSDGQPFVLTVTDDVNTLYATVVLNSTPEVKPIRATAAQVTVQFVAVDPIKYDASALTTVAFPYGVGGMQFNLFTPSGTIGFTSTGTTGRGTITNNGTAPVYPSFTVIGPVDQGFNIVNSDTGATISCAITLNAGDVVTVNQRTGRLIYNGVTDITNYLVSAGFFNVPPQTTTNIVVSSRGSASQGTLNISMSNGYW